jgi:molybdate transport system regulatory protein
MARLTLRVDLGPDQAIGPGKIRLLETIGETGSISEAGRQLGMSYRRAWLLVADLNQCFRQPVVSAQKGGARGGGALLTPFGTKLIGHYRAIEEQAHEAAADRLRALSAALQPRRRAASKRQQSHADDG